jgi:cell wall-associated NlpC family hydrolase
LSRCRTLCAGLLLAVFVLPVAQADARRITFGERDLRQGMRGTDVRVLQDFLTKAGLKTTVDGQFGSGTKRRVRSWERKSKLPINGVVTREDAATLRGQVGQDASGLQNTGGAQPVAAPTGEATLGSDGLAVAPAGAPPEVAAVIAAANKIVGKPYRYGGGHGDWDDSGYDCSGSESYALHGAGLVSRPMNSSEFMSWGEAGPGEWITSYANSGHSYLVVAGLRFDTGYNGGGSGPKWSAQMRPSDGYTVRHPVGL